jgi:hypothetical protein
MLSSLGRYMLQPSEVHRSERRELAISQPNGLGERLCEWLCERLCE